MYHEKKVQNKSATFLDAGFYLQNPQQLSPQQKISRLDQRILLNQRSKVNVVRFSLHFNPSDRLGGDDLKQIAAVFLGKLGFDKQPYLLYEHHDTLNKHVHIVSTLIRADGSRIKIQNSKISPLLKVERALETEFGLMSPFAGKPALSTYSQPGPLTENESRLGMMKSAIEKTLQQYIFCSFLEYNAVLRQFGVQASKGRQDSYLFKFRGLVYRTVDALGHATCKAVKASSLHAGATLRALEVQFALHKEQQFKKRNQVMNTIDLTIRSSQPQSVQSLAGALASQGVKMHITKEANRNELHLIYIDNRTKCAFDANMLGENYKLENLYKRCAEPKISIRLAGPVGDNPENKTNGTESWLLATENESSPIKLDALLYDLFAHTAASEQIPFFLRKPAKKRKRKTTR